MTEELTHSKSLIDRASYKIEPAKSDRSTCKLRSCSQKIEKGEIRIGTCFVVKDTDYEQTKWHHLNCFYLPKRFDSAEEFFEELEGIDDLSAEERRLLTSIFTEKEKLVISQQQTKELQKAAKEHLKELKAAKKEAKLATPAKRVKAPKAAPPAPAKISGKKRKAVELLLSDVQKDLDLQLEQEGQEEELEVVCRENESLVAALRNMGNIYIKISKIVSELSYPLHDGLESMTNGNKKIKGIGPKAIKVINSYFKNLGLNVV